jgi:hypothetical protein
MQDQTVPDDDDEDDTDGNIPADKVPHSVKDVDYDYSAPQHPPQQQEIINS